EVFVMVDIPLEKVDKLQKWLCENYREEDEITDSKVQSVVNILFSYNGITKLIHVDYLENSAAYIKKYYWDVLKSIIPQLIHLPCLVHILNLIEEV
ncbi:4630_t:CDS:2, partial [Diversispora eburnea]